MKYSLRTSLKLLTVLNMSIKKLISDLLLLITFFTPIPIFRKSTELKFSSLYLLPLVGVVRGLIPSSTLYILTVLGLHDPTLLSSVMILTHFIAQGFLHVDGFIDFSEAILASRFGVNAYKVVKDRYRGSYAIAVFTSYTLILYSTSTSLINMLGLKTLVYILLILEVWIFNIITLLTLLSKVCPEGIGALFKSSLRVRDVVAVITISSLLTILITYTASMNPTKVLLSLTVSTVISLELSRSLALKTLGFVNGDVLGFSSEVFYITSIITLQLMNSVFRGLDIWLWVIS